MSTKPIVQFIEKPMSGEWGVEPTNGHSIGVIRNANFTNEGVMDLSDIAYRDIPEKKIKQKALKHGDIIIEKSGGSPTQPVGRVVYYDRADGELMFSNFTATLRPRPGVDSRYLFFMLWATHLFKKTSAYQNKTTGIANLQLERYINEVELPDAPLPEQRRIAAILDKAQALVANDKRTLAVYDQLAKSLFLEMFGDPVRNERGWEVVKLTDACAQITDGTHFSPPMVESGFPYVTAKHIKEYGLDFESAPTYVDQEHHEEIYRRCKPELGDVLYIKDGATTGIAAVNTMAQPFSLLSSVALFKPNKHRITGTYLCNWLNHAGVRERLIRTHMAGAAIKRFTLQKINQFEIPLPPLKQQQEYEKAIVRLSAQRVQAERSLRQSEDLFGSLLQGAFSGDLA